MDRSSLELLAPAGNLEVLKAVVDAGADSVYLGGNMFGARAYAKNFSEEELIEGIEYAHLHNARVCMTVNTLLKQKEIQRDLYSFLKPYYENGVDALIMQDFGAIRFVKEYFPGLAIHSSTQMTVAGVDGARFLKNLGVERVVGARELSLKEIRRIHEEVGVEFESFIHGALCYSYSGQCLMSSMLGGRSGNRGRCAGTCRLPYEIHGKKNVYALSLKDLCTIDFIPDLAESGVFSFKIEGRMKTVEYAAGVVSVYRKYMDQYLKHGREGYQVTKADYQRLLDFGNRSGFTKGFYYVHNDSNMITYEKPNHQRSDDVKAMAGQKAGKDNKIAITGKGSFLLGKPMTLELSWEDQQVEVSSDIVDAALKRPMTRENIEEKLRKTGDSPFLFSKLELEVEDGIFVPVQKVNELRRRALEALVEKKLAPKRRATLPLLQEKDFYLDWKKEKKTNPCLQVSVMSREQLKEVIQEETVSGIYLDSYLYEHQNLLAELEQDQKKIHEAGKKVSFIMPYIFRNHTRDFYDGIWEELSAMVDGILVKNYDEIGFLKEKGYDFQKVRLDFSVYSFSNYAKKAFAEVDCQWDTIPVELNRKEMEHRDNWHSEMIIYGRIPLMTTANCVHKNFSGCDKKKTVEKLTDRYEKTFSVLNHCTECYNMLFNSDCLQIIDKVEQFQNIGADSYRMMFTLESAKETQEVLSYYKKRVLKGQEESLSLKGISFTNGHLNRGVE